MNKQIDELAKDLNALSCTNRCPNCKHFYNEYEVSCVDMNFAEKLYDAGYRKQVEGEWVKYGSGFYCSLCTCTQEKKTNFCPNCGAHMRGGENE